MWLLLLQFPLLIESKDTNEEADLENRKSETNEIPERKISKQDSEESKHQEIAKLNDYNPLIQMDLLAHFKAKIAPSAPEKVRVKLFS